MSFKHELGSTVRCKVTGFTGVVKGRTEWLYGCRSYSVQSKDLKDGKPIENVGFDEDSLEVVEAVKPHVMRETGGPTAAPAAVNR